MVMCDKNKNFQEMFKLQCKSPYFRCRVNWSFPVVQILLNIPKVSCYSVSHVAVLRCILSSKSVLFLTSVRFLKIYMFNMASLRSVKSLNIGMECRFF